MKLKKQSTILSRLIDKTMISTAKVNDFTPGSVIRSIYEAVALELEQFYMLTRQNINKGIREGVMEAFDFERRKARKAYGDVTLRFYNPTKEPFVISRGTTFLVSRAGYTQQYETLDEYRVPEGLLEANVEVYCKENGEIGNIPEGYIDTMSTTSTLIKSIKNEQSFSTGQDEESLTSLKRRFHLFIESRGRATNRSIEYGARQVEDIEGVYIQEVTGHVTVYAHDRNGNLTDTLKEEVKKALKDYQPSGISLSVEAVQKTMVDVSVGVTLTDKTREGNTLRRHIESVIRAYINESVVNEDLILTELIQVIMSIDDQLIYDIDIIGIEGNISTLPHELVRAGEINVEFV